MKRITIISSLLAALFLSFSCGGNPSPDGEAGRRLALLDEYVKNCKPIKADNNNEIP